MGNKHDTGHPRASLRGHRLSVKDKAEPVAEGLTEKGQQLHNSRMQEEERAAWPKGSGAKQPGFSYIFRVAWELGILLVNLQFL